jgi:perosamine synthetase
MLLNPRAAGEGNLVGEYERLFSSAVLGENIPCMAFWRGRVALWTLLRALKVQEHDEVILPAYTCEMVPAAVRFAGAKCVFVDVAPGDVNAAPDAIESAITSRTKAIICQHTYGSMMPMRPLKQIADSRNIRLLADCCQVVFDPTDRPVQFVGTASYFSMQWSKPFTTGLGGMAAFSDPELYRNAQDIRGTFLHGTDQARAKSLSTQVLLYSLTVRPRTRWIAAAAYRWAQKVNLVRGTTSISEYNDAMPSDYLVGAVNVQAALGMEQLRKWPANVRHRRMITDLYLEHLRSWDVPLRWIEQHEGHGPLWAVPLFVENKADILGRAQRAGLPIATWFGSVPLHIAASTAGRYNYRPSQCPQSEELFDREVHLVTSPGVTPRRAEEAIALLRKHAKLFAPIG